MMLQEKRKNFQKLITLPDEMMSLINDYRFKHRFSSVSATIRFLLKQGLVAQGEICPAPSHSPAEDGADNVNDALHPRSINDVTLPKERKRRLAIKTILDFLAHHGSTDFQSIEIGANGRRVINRNTQPLAGYKEIQKDKWSQKYHATYYFVPRAWRKILKDFNLEQATKDCAQVGLIMRPKTGQGLQIRKDIPGVDKKRVYAVRANHALIIYDALHRCGI